MGSPSGFWEDMGMYWAWRDKRPYTGMEIPPPPFEKVLIYSRIRLPSRGTHDVSFQLATKLIEPHRETQLHQTELSWWIERGAIVE